MRQTGRFITLEGIEGIGKTTQVEQVCECLRRAGIAYDVTREPGGTPVGEAIRGVLLDPGHADMTQDCEILLMFAARAQHIARRIRPQLEQGTWVVCDRFTDSSFAYQGGGRGLDRKRIEVLEQWTQAGLHPDLTLLLDGSPEMAMARVGTRGAKDRFEREGLDFFQRIRDAFLDRAHAMPERFARIDASGDIGQVSAQVRGIVDAFIKRYESRSTVADVSP